MVQPHNRSWNHQNDVAAPHVQTAEVCDEDAFFQSYLTVLLLWVISQPAVGA